MLPHLPRAASCSDCSLVISQVKCFFSFILAPSSSSCYDNRIRHPYIRICQLFASSWIDYISESTLIQSIIFLSLVLTKAEVPEGSELGVYYGVSPCLWVECTQYASLILAPKSKMSWEMGWKCRTVRKYPPPFIGAHAFDFCTMEIFLAVVSHRAWLPNLTCPICQYPLSDLIS